MQVAPKMQQAELLAYKALQAVQRGDTNELKNQLLAGADAHVINTIIKTGSPNARAGRDPNSSLLYHAVEKQNAELVNVLLSHGADVNGPKQEESPPPLRAAVVHKNEELVKLLLDKKANVNRKYTVPVGQRKVTQTAVFETTSDVVFEMLLRAGADVNAKDSKGNTPLHVRASEWNSRQVAALIEHGADVDAVNDDKHTPLESAIIQWRFPAGCDEEDDFIEICRVLLTNKAGVLQIEPSKYSSPTSDGEQLASRLQLVKEWAIQRKNGVETLTSMPLGVYQSGVAAIATFFATNSARGTGSTSQSASNTARGTARAPASSVAGALSDGETHEPEPVVPITRSDTWASREESMQRRPVKIPALDLSPRPMPELEAMSTTKEEHIDDCVNPIQGFSGPEVSLTAKATQRAGSVLAFGSSAVACEPPVSPIPRETVPAGATAPQRYHLKILGSSGLRSITMCRRQNPYCVCRLVGADGKTFQHFQTSVHTRGGQNPSWRTQLFEVVISVEEARSCTLVFVLKHSTLVSVLDNRIAQGTLPFPIMSAGQITTQKLHLMHEDQLAGTLEYQMEAS